MFRPQRWTKIIPRTPPWKRSPPKMNHKISPEATKTEMCCPPKYMLLHVQSRIQCAKPTNELRPIYYAIKTTMWYPTRRCAQRYTRMPLPKRSMQQQWLIGQHQHQKSLSLVSPKVIKTMMCRRLRRWTQISPTTMCCHLRWWTQRSPRAPLLKCTRPGKTPALILTEFTDRHAAIDTTRYLYCTISIFIEYIFQDLRLNLLVGWKFILQK